MRLEGKACVVTGAGSGIGREISRVFAREGATVALLDLNEAGAKETLGQLDGDGHLVAAVDVADGDSVRSAFADVDAALGRVDVLVNNAGVDRTPGDGFDEMMKGEQQLLHMTDDAFRRMMAINVDGVFFGTREALRIMQREGKGGSIVNLSSIAGLAGIGTPHYAASKAAVLGFTRSCARTLGPQGIRMNAVCPGVIDTPMTEAVPDVALKGVIRTTPLGRMGEAKDIANAVLYLASDESGFVTGQWLSPNGGIVTC
jgi:3-oxoacyl-[acyl-carrier protein] reductase